MTYQAIATLMAFLTALAALSGVVALAIMVGELRGHHRREIADLHTAMQPSEENALAPVPPENETFREHGKVDRARKKVAK